MTKPTIFFSRSKKFESCLASLATIWLNWRSWHWMTTYTSRIIANMEQRQWLTETRMLSKYVQSLGQSVVEPWFSKIFFKDIYCQFQLYISISKERTSHTKILTFSSPCVFKFIAFSWLTDKGWTTLSGVYTELHSSKNSIANESRLNFKVLHFSKIKKLKDSKNFMTKIKINLF